jgi:hypothetical protein
MLPLQFLAVLFVFGLPFFLARRLESPTPSSWSVHRQHAIPESARTQNLPSPSRQDKNHRITHCRSTWH